MKKIPKKKRKVTELYFNKYDSTAEIYTCPNLSFTQNNTFLQLQELVQNIIFLQDFTYFIKLSRLNFIAKASFKLNIT